MGREIKLVFVVQFCVCHLLLPWLLLVVAGAISMADASLKIYARFTKTKVDDAVVKKASPGLSLGFFCVVIWGSIQVFGSHSDVCFALKDAVGDDLEYQCTD